MKKIVACIIVLSCVIASCGTFKIALSDELKKEHDAYEVKGKDGLRIRQKISFGQFSTTTINRSWTKGNSSIYGLGYHDQQSQEWVNLISMEYIRKKQTIRYDLTDGVQHSSVYCVSRFDASELQVGKSKNSLLNIGIDILGITGRPSSMYYVQIFTSGTEDRPWEMSIDNELSQRSPRKYVGYLGKTNDDFYSIVPVTRLEKNGKEGNILAGSVGFEFRDPEGRAVAAVSPLNRGMVFLAKLSAERRFLLANACTALLLQDVIE